MSYGHDSLTAVQRISSHAWYKNKPLNYKLEKSANSQELPKIDLIGYGLSLIIKDVIFETRNVIGNSPSFYTLDSIQSIDINCIDEFKLAEYVYNGIKSEL
jgi:CMP-N-acetylneuraminic acid synthetase